MPRIKPLPFRLPMQGTDTVGLEGARSVSYQLEGLLHLRDDTITLEWTGTERTQQLTFGGIKDVVDHFPVEWIEVPASWITGVRLKGGWWMPRLELRADRLEAFEGTPTARPGLLTLRIRRHDRELARQMVAAIASAARLGEESVSAPRGVDP